MQLNTQTGNLTDRFGRHGAAVVLFHSYWVKWGIGHYKLMLCLFVYINRT